MLRALVAWGAPLVDGSQGGDAFRTHWLALGLPAYFDGVDVADLAPLTVVVRTGDAPATLRVSGNGVSMDAGACEPADDTVVVEGAPDAVLALLSGTGGPEQSQDLDVTGPEDAIQRLQALARRSRVAT